MNRDEDSGTSFPFIRSCQVVGWTTVRNSCALCQVEDLERVSKSNDADAPSPSGLDSVFDSDLKRVRVQLLSYRAQDRSG